MHTDQTLSPLSLEMRIWLRECLLLQRRPPTLCRSGLNGKNSKPGEWKWPVFLTKLITRHLISQHWPRNSCEASRLVFTSWSRPSTTLSSITQKMAPILSASAERPKISWGPESSPGTQEARHISFGSSTKTQSPGPEQISQSKVGIVPVKLEQEQWDAVHTLPVFRSAWG